MASLMGIKVGADTTQFTKDIKTVAQKTTVKIKVKADGTTEKLTTTMKKTEDGAGNLTTSIRKFNAEGKLVTNTVTTSSKAVKTLGQDFVETGLKVAKFAAVTAVIGLFSGAITEAISTTKELDASIIELRKVTDLSGESLKEYTQDAFDLAEQLYTTASNVTDAVTEFSKSGYTLKESMELGEQALVFQTIADGMVSASDSATMFIQTMKAYNMTVNEAAHITDAINEVDILAFPIRNFRVIKDNYIG